MKKILFLGCNQYQLPYLKEIKKLGYFVVGTDMNRNAPGVKYLDRYYQASYEDNKKLIEIGRKEKFTQKDGVFTAGSQFAYLGASRFAKYFKISFIDPDTVGICLSKTRFYALLKKEKVSMPKTWFVKTPRQLKRCVKNDKDYFLKSDFSKNPNYIYRIEKGRIPGVNWKKDRYLREYYVLQELVLGKHYRIDYFDGGFFYFWKLSDALAKPSGGINDPALQKRIEKALSGIIARLGLEKYFVKFDIIINKDGYFVLDIGIDPPLRYRLLSTALGHNFAKLYVLHYLKGVGYPKMKGSSRNVTISKRRAYIE